MFVINTSSTRYNVVRDAAMEVGWVVEDDKRKPTVPDRYLKESEQHSINIFEKSSTTPSSSIPPRRPTTTNTTSITANGARGGSSRCTRSPSGGSSLQKRNSLSTEADGDEERQLNSDGEENDDDDSINEGDTGKGVSNGGVGACGMTVEQERYLWKKFAGSVFAGSGTALLRRRSSSSCGGSSKTSTKGRKPTSSYSSRPSAPTPPQPSTAALPRSLMVTSRGGAGRYYDPSLHNQLYWTDMSVLPEKVSFMKPFQRLNHFPDMHLICRKMTLFVRLMKLKKRFDDVPGPYKKYLNFFPMSWSTKDGSNEKRQLEEFVLDLQRRKKFKTFIMKPNTGCQGKGILITRNPIVEMSPTMTRKGNTTPGAPVRYDPRQEYVVQLYVHRPLLIEERKFDLRVYVLVTSLSNPAPQIFVHKEGLVRLASEPYSRPYASKRKKGEAGGGGDGLYAHLTNYAVSKAKIKEVGAKAASNAAGKGSSPPNPKKASPPTENGGTDPSPQNDDNAMFKRDFAFLETFVNSSCKQWVDPKARAAAAESDCDEEEEDTVLPDGPTTASDTDTTSDKKAPSFSKPSSSSSGPSISSTPLELCEGITPFSFLMQQIDRAVVISILSALPDLQRSLSTASFRGSATAAPCLPLANSLTMASSTPPPTAGAAGGSGGDGGASSMDEALGGTADGTPTSSAAGCRTMPRSSYGGRPSTSSSMLGGTAPPTIPGGGLAPYLSTRDGRGCFELLGYDVLIREGDGKVDIMEINHSPSLFCDSAFDQKIKQKVVSDTLRILKPNMIPVKKTATGGGGDLSYLNDVVLSSKAQRSTWDVLGSGATNFRQVHPVPNSITSVERALGEGVVYRHATSSGGPAEEIPATPMAKYGRPFFLHAETSPYDSFDPFSPVDLKARLKRSLLSVPQLGITHDVLYQLTKHHCGGATSSAASRARVEQHAERQRQLGRELDPNACVIKYDPNAGHQGFDPSYTPYPQYCIWLRHLYDTIMVQTGVFPGY
jgi:hypothetical protein